ncbi:MAG: cytochrome c-type biogenesis protein CcmH [Gammaproteobacteria bacterium]|nr:cytochrome c-type biogenesis protein CcmH [Gammaproteobacteria bacterium]MDE0450735.1 cytochrome c-type biogenesis protein CcmH [Gammaproteobacteria bacterium]
MMLRICTLLIATSGLLGASAIDGFDFSDPDLADRYRELLAELRCPKCLNESLASSGAPIARDLRRTVRRLLEDGATDDDVRVHLQERYGDFVLYDPEFRMTNWPLWAIPPLLLLVAIVVVGRVGLFRRRAPLDDRERERIARLLEDDP